MSVLFDKLAQAGTSARALLVGAETWCRICDRGAAELRVDAPSPEPFIVLDCDQPTGICRDCAERLGWHRFFISSPDFIDGEAQAA